MTRKNHKTSSRKGKAFRLKVPAVSENLDIIRKFIGGIAENAGFSEDDIYQIELAVDEAAANVIKHAYTNEHTDEKLIHITVQQKPDKLEITIADKGVGFDPDSVPTPDIEEYLKKLKPGGLGLHLIRTLMDEVSFSIRPGVRNAVRMVKYLSRQ
ncbi:MAG: ATP-binding protein [Calditrichaeota bacterium]|nr:MAG: ATP-binding protein [Calditrichota bacterium]